jgi:hypothetical protein
MARCSVTIAVAAAAAASLVVSWAQGAGECYPKRRLPKSPKILSASRYLAALFSPLRYLPAVPAALSSAHHAVLCFCVCPPHFAWRSLRLPSVAPPHPLPIFIPHSLVQSTILSVSSLAGPLLLALRFVSLFLSKAPGCTVLFPLFSFVHSTLSRLVRRSTRLVF